MFTARRTVQLLIAGILLAGGTAALADGGQDGAPGAAIPEARAQAGSQKVACSCASQGGATVRLATPGSDPEIDRLRAQGG